MYRSYVSSVKAVSFTYKSEVCATICQIAALYGRHSLIFENEICYNFNFSETLQCKFTANGSVIFVLCSALITANLGNVFLCFLDSMLLTTGCVLVFCWSQVYFDE